MSGNDDRAPGARRQEAVGGIGRYLVGLALAGVLTAVSFGIALDHHLFWQPGVAIGLMVLAVAQIGIHLVFFLHLSTGPDNTNNALAVAFGVLIVVLIGGGSLWIMSNLDHMMPAGMNAMAMKHR